MPGTGNLWFIRPICESADIFISYSRADRERAEILARALEATGFSTWVADEAELAREKGKLIPVLIEDVQPKMGFRQFQAIDFQCWAGDVRDSPFTALLTALRRYTEPAETAPVRPPPLELAPEQQQRYLFNALLDLTRRLSNTVPCVILLDDLHWADESSMALIEHIAPHVANLPLRQLTVDDVAELLLVLGGHDPPDNLVNIIIMFSRLYHFQHTFQHRAYLAGIDETIELQKAHGGGPEFSRPLGSAIVACVCAGAFDRVRAISEEVMPLALATGDAGTIAQTSLFGGMVDTAEGHFAEARTRMNGAVKIYHETGMPWESAALAAAVGPVILMGDWEAARIDSERAVEIAVDCPTFDGYEKAQLLYLRTLMGDERAPGLLDEYENLLPTRGQLNGLGSWHMLTVWVECAALLEQHARAAPHYDLAVDLLRDKTVTTYYPVLIERIAGIAALCGDRFDLAEAHFDAALQQAEALPFVSEQGEIRRWRALMLLRRNAPGDRGRARKLLQEAGSVYSRHGMPKHRGMTEKILENL